MNRLAVYLSESQRRGLKPLWHQVLDYRETE
jgi:hypothetical protein